MILLGLVLLVVGLFLFRPLAYVGIVLLAIGVILALTTAGGLANYGYY